MKGTAVVCLLVTLVVGGVMAPGHCAPPGVLTYQGALTDAAGSPADGTYSMAFGMYAARTGGAPLWSETMAQVKVTDGVFTVLLGATNPLPAGLKGCNYLEVSVGGTPMAPRQRLSSVPYALEAANAAKLDGYTSSTYRDAHNINTGTLAVARLPMIPANKLLAGAVTAPKIADGAVTSGKIGSEAVTTGKIAPGAVTGDKIAPGTGVTTNRPGDFVLSLVNEAASGHGLYVRGGDYGILASGGKSEFVGDVYMQNQLIVTGYATFQGGHGPHGDLAENYYAREVEAGDVVVIGPDGKLARCAKACDPRVAGIVSTSPSMNVGGLEAGAETVPLALVGIVPCKVDATRRAIRAGDLLVSSSTPGHAMRCPGDRPKAGTVIGKALEALANGRGVIQVLVTLR